MSNIRRNIEKVEKFLKKFGSKFKVPEKNLKFDSNTTKINK